MELKARLQDIIKRKAEGLNAMKTLLDKADEEERELTEAEEADFTFLDNEVEKLKKEEARTHKMIEDETILAEPQRTVRMSINKRVGSPEEFKSLGEFLYAVRFQPQDERLSYVEMDSEQRQQSMGVGVEGGFAVPTQFIPTLRMVDPQTAIYRPRCTVIPAGDPPDAEVSMPALDQGAAQNMYGGMTVAWISEAATKPETDLVLREIKLTPHEVAGYTILTDKLLRNWGAASSLIESMLRKCVIGAEETAFAGGSGVGQPLGVRNAPARIDINRAGANAIAFADVYGMLARLKRGGSPVWLGSPTILPQLIAMTDAGTNSVWLPGNMNTIGAGAANASPNTLFGIPLMWDERAPALGTAGDLSLVDLSYYLIKDGSGPFVATSEHVHFLTNRTVIKIFWNVDGGPWLNEPIPLEGSAANTLSPFVILDTP